MLRSRGARLVVIAVVAVFTLLSATFVLAAPVGTAFTYQGQLRQAGVAVNGTCDLQFSLFDAAAAGVQIGATQAASGITVVDGRFTVQLDFGSTAFNGEARWLQISTRCPSGSGAFTQLDPRQPLTPSPYSITISRLLGQELSTTAPVDGQVLRFNGGTNRWEAAAETSTRNYFSVSAAGANATPTTAPVRFAVIDTADGWTLTGPGPVFDTFTATQAGTYQFNYFVRVHNLAPAAPRAVDISVERNGTDIPASEIRVDLIVNGPDEYVSTTFLAQIAAGDVLRLVKTESTSLVTIDAANFSAIRIR